MTDVVARAKAALEGVTEGPWAVDCHEANDYDSVTVGAGTYLSGTPTAAEIVQDFIDERRGFITAIENCAPDNTADYWRWQGHAEARRHLSERLAVVVGETPKTAQEKQK